MSYEVVLTDTAKAHYDGLEAGTRARIRKGLQEHLAHEPTKLSRSRIKRLQEMEHPEYRLRLDPFRVFYDVVGRTVVVLAIVPKQGANEWLDENGERQA